MTDEAHPLVQLIEYAAEHGLSVTVGPCEPDEDDDYQWIVGWMDRMGGDEIAWIATLDDALDALDDFKDVVARRQEWRLKRRPTE